MAIVGIQVLTMRRFSAVGFRRKSKKAKHDADFADRSARGFRGSIHLGILVFRAIRARRIREIRVGFFVSVISFWNSHPIESRPVPHVRYAGFRPEVTPARSIAFAGARRAVQDFAARQ